MTLSLRNSYFVPKRNIIHERARFHQRKQLAGESVEAFIRSLYEIAEHCAFNDKNEQIRDRLVLGVADKEVSEKLQLKSDLTLESAIEMARQRELVKTQMKDIDSPKALDAVQRERSVGRGQSSGRGHSRNYRSRPGGRGHHPRHRGSGRYQGHQARCQNCNGTHAQETRCPAKGKRCHRCRNMDHFASCCRKNVNEVVHEEHESDNSLFLGSVTTCNDNSEAWNVKLKICGKPVVFKIDSGADTSVISDKLFYSLPKRPKLSPVKGIVSGIGGVVKCEGEFKTHTWHNGNEYVFPVHVIKGTQTSLLGRSTAEKLGLIKRIFEAESVFGTVGRLDCEPVKITLKTDAKPYCLTTARHVAFPLMGKVETELNRLEKEGIINKVVKPTDWCAPMVPVVKRNGNVRICVDLKKLNEAVKREHLMLPNLEDISPKLQGSKIFSKLDASNGFHQIPLDEDSCHLTTFITPFGRYCFTRVPFGITSASEIFQRKMSELLKGLIGVEVIIDDILIHAATMHEHDERLSKALERIKASGMKLNRDKCEFRKPEIEYLGHVISADGVKPSYARIEAIRELPAPTNVTELRRIIGMINYLGRFVPNMATIISPITELLKEDVAWTWDFPQQKSFEEVKKLLTNSPVLAFYDANKSTIVSADASSFGLGAALFQIDDGELKPVAFCSRKLTPAEMKYAQIEKECLASVWACEKFSCYLVGLDSFTLYTDHKPLIPLMNTQDLDRTPLRCQRLLMRLRRFNVKAEHVSGKKLFVPDTLSRSPIDKPSNNELADEVAAYVHSVESTRPISDQKLDQIRMETAKDPTLQEVMSYTRFGWPNHSRSMKDECKEYYSSRSKLSISEGLVIYRHRITIPEVLRSEIIEKIHEGHQGINKCRERANTCVWWPGIVNDIRVKISSCQFCQIAHLPTITSAQVIGKLKNIFARFGIPEELVSDNGKQFVSEAFHDFATSYNFKQTFSSPHYPQANGMAESSVKIAKRILRQDDIFKALLAYRSTPIESTGVSPAQLLMGRQIRTTLPTLSSSLQPKWPEYEEVHNRDNATKIRTQEYYNRRYSASPLSKLHPGDAVRIKTDKEKRWNSFGTITGTDHANRSYTVSTPTGNFRRNRRHLQSILGDSVPQISRSPVDQDLEISQPKISVPIEPSVNDRFEDKIELVLQPDIANSDVLRTRSGRAVIRPKHLNDYV
ncbi:hypothetical protein FSP39_022529 [Pinctada imbricata]|uniref:Endonuclease n=1 Tax=Pinctada imbricata TaxID=66713 RepID=A0AA88XSY1_PINIB|nr:hypothetical protein FSP39_022529 [Pinctada imbricata]